MSSLDIYPPGKMIGKFFQFNLYECQVPDSDNKTGILKIASGTEHNHKLDLECLVLEILKEESNSIEEQYGEKNPGSKMNFNLLFPVLESSFLAPEQGNRRVNIIHFPKLATTREELVPLSNITRDGFRIDPKTSAWIFGKFLKALTFTHGLNISIGNINASKLIIHPQHHLVSIFDWSEAVLHSGIIPEEIVRVEISSLARITIELLAGDVEKETLPESDQLDDNRFKELLMKLTKEGSPSAVQAHKEFYDLVEVMWGRKYHPFTAIPL